MKYIKSITKMLSGVAAYQIINVAGIAVIAKMYGPEAFGTYAVFSAILVTLNVFSTLQLEVCIIKEYNDDDANAIRKIIIKFGLYCVAISVVLASASKILFPENLEYDTLKIILMGIALLNSNINYANYNWNNRMGNYGLMAKSLVIIAITQTTISIIGAWASQTENGLIYGLIAGQMAAAAYLREKREWKFNLKEMLILSNKEIKLIQKNKKFAFNLTPSALLEKFASQTYLIFVSSIFGNVIVGYINMYMRVVSVPQRLIKKSIGEVFRREIALKLKSNEQNTKLLVTTMAGLALVSMPIFLALYINGEELFSYFLGVEWSEAGKVSETLSIIFLFAMIVSPVSSIIRISDAPELDLKIQIFLAIGVIFSLLAAIVEENVKVFLNIYVMVYVIKYLIEASVGYKLSKSRRIN